jgi:hypothetical protein
MSGLTGFRQAFQFIDGASASDGPNLTNAITAGNRTAPFGMVPLNKTRVLGAWFRFIATTTATAAATPVSGSDALDLFLSGGADIEISAETNGPLKSQILGRKTAEFMWAVCTDVNPNVAAATTFTTSGTSTETIYLFLPLGQAACSVKFLMPGNISAAYSANVTISYTSIYSYIISTDWAGEVVYNEQETASIGTTNVDMTPYVPKTVKPDAIFLSGESTTTVTSLTMITVGGTTWLQTTVTTVSQFAAAAIANVAGATYTTNNGFVIYGGGFAFQTFQMTFSSATTHFIAYLQISGGEPVATQASGSPTPAPPATSLQGTQTPAGQVKAQGGAAGAGLPTLKGGGAAGGIISRRT